VKSTKVIASIVLFIVVAGVVLYQFLAGVSTGLESSAGDRNDQQSQSTDADDPATGSAATLAGFESCTLVRVVDGDTIVVSINGSQDTVRLIGINAPESVHPDASQNTAEGAAASQYLSGLLTPGQTLWLQKDTSDRDQYDRLLRYVWLELPNDPENYDEVAAKMLNARLVAAGHAEAKRYPPDTHYAEALEQAGL